MRNASPFELGCVADDFTGAGDVASFIARNGARCLLINGVPKKEVDLPGGYDAVVIALKSRTAPPERAVKETETAFDWLKKHGARQLYFKYCSTFDSTKRGNIGPVMDNLLDKYDLPYSILCPALPVNGRIVKDGKLYVNGVALDQSPMRNHPLNPMWDSDVAALMQAQSNYPCRKLTFRELEAPDETVLTLIRQWEKEAPRFYIAVDCFEESHGKRIAGLFEKLPLLSGGSFLPAHLVKATAADRRSAAVRPAPPAAGRALILAGSCSEMTRRQIRHFEASGGVVKQIIPLRLLDGTQTDEELWDFVRMQKDQDVLLYSAQPPDEIAAARDRQGEVSAALEALMARLARLAIQNGVCRLVVAGGETSGAVVRALGWSAYEIGPCVVPGVPVLLPAEKPQVQLVLKSGNFGDEDFFCRCLTMMRGTKE